MQELHYKPGDTVMYGLHGKCRVDAVISREVGGQPLHFYRLQVVRSPSARSDKPAPTIMLPIENGNQLRPALGPDQAEAVLAILQNREHYFSTELPLEATRTKLDACILREGCQGLAKVYSYLWVLSKRQVVPPTEVAKLLETVEKHLFRELSEALSAPQSTIRARIGKGLKSKLAPDH